MTGDAWADQRRRWAATHGLVRGATARRARDGVESAALALDPAAEPGPVWERLRAHRPFAPGPVPGVLVTVHHDVAREVLVSDAFGMPAAGVGGPPGPLSPPSPIALDGAEHTRLRARHTASLHPRAVAGWVGRCAEIAGGLLDALAAGSDDVVDLVAGYAHPLPLLLVTEILGLPADDAPLPPELPRWGDAVVAALDVGLPWERFVEVEADLAALHGWLTGQVAAARARGGDGLLARLTTSGPDGDPVNAAMFLLAAGFETTTHAVTAGVVLLADHPEHRARLRGEPAGWPAAVEEILRLASPVTRAVRTARRDVEVAGTVVPAGTVVEVWLGAAARDPRVFDRPGEFDPDRVGGRAHLAFGHGPHHCLGAALARMESAVALRALVDRFPDVVPVGTGSWRPTRLVRGRVSLPVRLSGAVRRCAS
jgi:cytochrome P450